MRTVFIILTSLLFSISQIYAKEEEKKVIPPDINWEQTNDRDISFPLLYQGEKNVYVYSEKQLDNLTIGITDMAGNVYHEEVTTVPAGMYYAISIESLPAGQYYLCIYQGSNYVIGVFTKD